LVAKERDGSFFEAAEAAAAGVALDNGETDGSFFFEVKVAAADASRSYGLLPLLTDMASSSSPSSFETLLT